MLKYIVQGFTLGLAYLAPIGMQNLYVINSALRFNRIRAYQVAGITTFFDISLALACFFGVGAIIDRNEMLKMAVLLIGSMTVIYIGINLIRSQPELSTDIKMEESLSKIAWACFVVTWLNPQAIIDGSLLLGGFKASLPQGASQFFILGVCMASMLWFSGLVTLVSTFRNIFNDKILKGINTICGGIVIYYGLKLGFSFIGKMN
ncbi:MAG: LysE/ArgO family amino acid transporter [Bacillota bacterium]